VRLIRRAAAAEAADPGVVLQLAILLQTGIAPDRAWCHLAETDATARIVVAERERGADLAAAIGAAGDGWREVGIAWRVAATVGAPLAGSLRAIAVALGDASDTRDEVRVALAEPAGTARLMSWLPLVGVALGSALGFDTVRTLVTDPFGVACLVAGLALMLAAHRWNAALARRAAPGRGVPGLDAELLAIALSGGVSLDRAREIVADAGGALADEDDPAGGGTETARILALSASAGVPAVELLRACASMARHRARTTGRVRAARLSTRLLIPLGVCTLPAFLLLGVAPMLLSILSSTPLSL